MKEKNKGITLIALIITIIVMLILVGVTVNVAMQGGLFSTARKAASETQEAKEQEILEMKLAEIKMDHLNSGLSTEFAEDLQKSLQEAIKDATVDFSGEDDGPEKDKVLKVCCKCSAYIVDCNYKITAVKDVGLWILSEEADENVKYNIIGYAGTGDDLVNVTVPNALKLADNTIVLIEQFGGEYGSLMNETQEEYVVFAEKLKISDRLTVSPGVLSNPQDVTTIEIGEDVTINASAFDGCTLATSINIGNDSTIIAGAFATYLGITTLSIGDNVTIGTGAFMGCSSLKKITIGKNAQIADQAFKDNGALQTVIIKAGYILGRDVFSGCPQAIKDQYSSE